MLIAYILYIVSGLAVKNGCKKDGLYALLLNDVYSQTDMKRHSVVPTGGIPKARACLC